MPSFSKALKKANGSLFPFGWYYLMKAQKKNDTAAFYLIGVDPEYQGKGVTAIIFEEMGAIFPIKISLPFTAVPFLTIPVESMWS